MTSATLDPNDFVKDPAYVSTPPSEPEDGPDFDNTTLVTLLAHGASITAGDNAAAFRAAFVEAVLPAFELADVAGALYEMGIDSLEGAELPAWVRLTAASAWAAYMFVTIRKGLKSVPSTGSNRATGGNDSDGSPDNPDTSEFSTDNYAPDF